MALHPFIVALLESMAGRPAISAGTPEDARALVAATREAIGKGPEMRIARDLEIPTRAGAIPGRLYVPEGGAQGLVVYYHGGGWLLGALDDYDTLCRALAAESGCAVLAPDYRLSPEHPFPAGLEDCEDALRWAVREAAALAAPQAADRIVLAGDSAGGNLATIVARRLQGEITPRLQALIYPVADCDLTRDSYREHGEGLPLTAKDMAWFFAHYAPEARWADPDISPIRGPLAGLPPAVVVTAEHDVLADEGRAYADALEAAGVTVTRRHVPGVTHGFIRLHNLFDVARHEVEALGRDIAEACK